MVTKISTLYSSDMHESILAHMKTLDLKKDELKQQKTTLGSTFVSLEQESEATLDK